MYTFEVAKDQFCPNLVFGNSTSSDQRSCSLPRSVVLFTWLGSLFDKKPNFQPRQPPKQPFPPITEDLQLRDDLRRFFLIYSSSRILLDKGPIGVISRSPSKWQQRTTQETLPLLASVPVSQASSLSHGIHRPDHVSQTRSPSMIGKSVSGA